MKNQALMMIRDSGLLFWATLYDVAAYGGSQKVGRIFSSP